MPLTGAGDVELVVFVRDHVPIEAAFLGDVFVVLVRRAVVSQPLHRVGVGIDVVKPAVAARRYDVPVAERGVAPGVELGAVFVQDGVLDVDLPLVLEVDDAERAPVAPGDDEGQRPAALVGCGPVTGNVRFVRDGCGHELLVSRLRRRRLRQAGRRGAGRRRFSGRRRLGCDRRGGGLIGLGRRRLNARRRGHRRRNRRC